MEKLTSEGKHNWEYYKARIDLVEFAQWKGYGINLEKTSRNYAVLKKEGDIIIVFQNRTTGYQGYFNPNDANDTGNILNFEFNRSKRDWRAVFGALDNFLNESEAGKIKIRRTHLRPTPPPEAVFDASYDFGFQEPFDLSYLNRRGISTATLSVACFKGQVFNGPFIHNGITYVNTLFPLRNQTGVVAAIIRNVQYNKIERARGDACWVSNLDTNNTDNVTMVITESPIDALSYHQLFPAGALEQRLYVATAGNLSESQPQYIQYLIEVYQPRKVVLANDNDKAGFFQNVKLMGLLSHPQCADNLKVSIQVQGENAVFLLQYEGEAAHSKVYVLEAMAERYFKTARKFVASRKDEGVDIHLQNIPAHFKELETLLLNEKQPRDWLKIHRPQTKDFNEDLVQMAVRDSNYHNMSF